MPDLPGFTFKWLLPLLVAILVSCGGDNNDVTELARREHYAEVIEVRTAPAVQDNFARV